MNKFLLIAFLGSLVASTFARADVASEKWFTDMFHQATTIVRTESSNALIGSQQSVGICSVIDKYFSIDSIAEYLVDKSILDNSSQQEQAHYYNAIRSFIANTVAMGFSSLEGEFTSVKISGGSESADTKTLNVALNFDGAGEGFMSEGQGKSYHFAIYINKNDGKIFNVSVLGMDMISSKKSEFSVVAKGKLKNIIKALDKLNKKNLGSCPMQEEI